MRKHLCWPAALFLLLFLAQLRAAVAQAGPGSGSSLSFKPGLRFDYISRTLSGDDGQSTSQLTSYFGAIVIGLQSRAGFWLAGLVGYSSSTFDGLSFRDLPLSVEYEGGGTKGLIVGGEINAGLLSAGSLAVDAFGQFLACLGTRAESSLPGLAVPGTVEGKPTWMHASIGPVFSYRGRGGFYPYLYPSFDYLWGTYEMNETIETLTGTENKKIKSKSLFGVAVGAALDVSPSLSLKGEAGLYPYQGGTDYSVTVKALFSL
jgi:hypothetical protein